MSEKIEVCGKILKPYHHYNVKTLDSGWKILQFKNDGGFTDPNNHKNVWYAEKICDVHGINGEVLEDAPFKPEVGQWCLFSDHKDFKYYSISKLKTVEDTTIDVLFIDVSDQGWYHCKPVSPELAALLDKELD